MLYRNIYSSSSRNDGTKGRKQGWLNHHLVRCNNLFYEIHRNFIDFNL